jgi:hypothetical protein
MRHELGLAYQAIVSLLCEPRSSCLHEAASQFWHSAEMRACPLRLSLMARNPSSPNRINEPGDVAVFIRT